MGKEEMRDHFAGTAGYGSTRIVKGQSHLTTSEFIVHRPMITPT